MYSHESNPFSRIMKNRNMYGCIYHSTNMRTQANILSIFVKNL